MKPVPKCLYYIEKDDLDHYLDGENSVLNNLIYDVLLKVRHPNEVRYSLKMEMQNIFNEAYAQATRIANDKHPESNFYYDYYLDIRHHVERQYEVRLILSVVYMILSLQTQTARNIKYAINSIDETLKESTDYFPDFKSAVEDYLHRYDDLPEDFYWQIKDDVIQTDFTQHLDPSKFISANWYEYTDHFEESGIERMLQYGKTKNEKKAILKAIRESYSQCEQHNADELLNDDLPF